MGGTRAQRAVALQALLAALAGDLVEHLDEDREADGRVQVAFRDMEAQALGSQAEADHHQEAQAQHDHRRVTIDEAGQRLAGDDHQADGDDHRDHHHFQVLDMPTAVITASSENTASSTTICATIGQNSA